MTHRQIGPLHFKVWSPSLWELRVDEGQVNLAYTGPEFGWAITVQMPEGRIIDRRVKDFQAGIALLSSRVAA